MDEIQGPSPRPCESCPYRRDTPSGVWAKSEYLKLAQYDRETPYQPSGIFQCHQHGDDGKQIPRVCAGWAAVHGPQVGDKDLISIRLAIAFKSIDLALAKEICEYVSPVPMFSSGTEAAVHGMRDIDNTSEEAERIKSKIVRLRSDIKYG